jgi:ABC-type glycerol-3-phosphate transport system permease component
LLSLNGEYGVNFEATMALATITTLPIAILFAATQRRVSTGLTAGAVKG